MKKLIFVIVSTLLIISILVNAAFYYVLYYQWDWDKETLQEKTILIHYLDNSKILKELNSHQLKKRISKPNYLVEIDSLRINTSNALNNIRNELVEFTGGLSEKGQFTNPKSKSYIESYFYKDNHLRPFGHKNFDNILLTYSNNIKETSGVESNIDGIIKILGYYNRSLPSEVFYDMTLSEAVLTIDLIKTKIELDFYEILLESKKEE